MENKQQNKSQGKRPNLKLLGENAERPVKPKSKSKGDKCF